jgi:hypothetical protein
MRIRGRRKRTVQQKPLGMGSAKAGVISEDLIELLEKMIGKIDDALVLRKRHGEALLKAVYRVESRAQRAFGVPPAHEGIIAGQGSASL